jgi:phosphohistidine phosphatase SixA
MTLRASLFALLLIACDTAPAPVDAGREPPDPCPSHDAGPPRPEDAGPPTVDAGRDAGPPPPEDAGPPPACDRPTVYYVIRHAERDPGLDPPINAEGEGRARRIAELMTNTGFDEVIVTSFLRNQQTAVPLAERTGVPVTVAPITMTGWPDFGVDVARWQLEREVPGRTYLMIGHAGGYNTALLRELGATVSIAERYQDLVIVTREPDGRVRWSILEYGGASSLDP